jgi:hypothetical protein
MRRFSQKVRMEEVANEQSPLASLEGIKGCLIGMLKAAATPAAPKVHLTYLGGEFAKLAGGSFEQHLNDLASDGAISMPVSKRKMVPFFKTYCHDQVGVERLDTGAFVAFLKGGVEGAPVLAPDEQPSTRAPLKFKRPVWAAFIRPIGQGRRFLNLDQIGFTDQEAPPSDGNWKEIAANFVLGAAPDAAIDGVDVQSRIESWARAADVPLSHLILTAATPSTHGKSLGALLDIIDALPPQIAASWSIPASVLKHLRHAR